MIFRSFYNFLEFPEYLELKIIPENELWHQHDLMLTSAGQRAVQVKPDVWGPHVSDSEANPVLTRALTRYGAHCQCHGVSLTRSLVLIRRATSAVAGVSPATTTADSGGAPCARYGAPFDVRFAPTGSWEKGASKEASDSSWGGRSCRRRAPLRLPEFGQSRGRG